MDLEDFRDEFLNEVNARVEAVGGFTDDAFAEIAASKLEDANELPSFEPCRYRSPNGRMSIDGYAFDDADDSLRVLLVHRSADGALRTLTQTDARSLFRRIDSFVENAFTGRFEGLIDENHVARDFAETLRQRHDGLSRIRAYLVSDYVLSNRVKDWPEGTIAGIPIGYHIWDISRFQRAHNSNTGLDDVVVDFSNLATDSAGLPCLAASTPGSPYEAYLCVVPAALLAKIYDEYGSRLLEGNVRSFLTAKGKVNQGIRRTLIERPEMFFAYNNGISAVASDVTLVATIHGQLLASATNLQIVNGGQTTASIENANRVDKARGLTSTFVPMKLSVLKGGESSEMISDISRYANSQNKVSDADFFANHPFHRRLEQISRRIWAPSQAGKQYQTRWYYERARGQYLNEFPRLTPAKKAETKLLMPKNQVVTKTDLAKSELSWQQRPHNVSAGAQIFFGEFAKRVSAAWLSDALAFNEEYYRSCVARIIIIRSAEAQVSRANWYIVGYRSIIVTYAIAKLAYEIDASKRGVIDFGRIWHQQAPHEELQAELLQIAEHVFNTMQEHGEPQRNLTQWAKRQSCWEHVRANRLPLSDVFLASLIDKSGASDEQRASRAMQQLDSGIDDQAAVLAAGSEYWKKLLAWAEQRGNLASAEDRALRAAAGFSDAFPTDKQCKRLIQFRDRCVENGFTIIST